MNYLVIDLEMCKVPKNYRGKNYKYASEMMKRSGNACSISFM